MLFFLEFLEQKKRYSKKLYCGSKKLYRIYNSRVRLFGMLWFEPYQTCPYKRIKYKKNRQCTSTGPEVYRTQMSSVVAPSSSFEWGSVMSFYNSSFP
jgi:hypothetical protein